MIHAVELEVGGRLLRLETGRMAKQADGAVLATYADTVILATAVSAKTMKPDIDFLPLTVNYQEKAYAAGKIPGGYFRREGAPSEKEVLTSRLIDRPIRPLMPEGYYCETQIIVSVLSVDQTMSSDIIGIVGASAAMAISDIPCDGPLAAVRIGRINGAFIVNPDQRQLESSELNLVVA
ncbi:MAG: polyribonucleotide nucleotidyltransferase, partial [Nitrospira sp.]|nr:polyribonucleotide nucleotidyltransferase [Nitrospira sp.]